MAHLLHADAVQQLEVALLGSPAAQVIDLLSSGLMQTKPSTSVAPAWPHVQTYTSTSPAPPPTSVLVVGVTTTSQIPVVVVPAMESTSGVDELVLPKAKISNNSQCHHITPTPLSLLMSTSLVSFPIVVVSKLAIPPEAYPECLNRLGGKDYLCHLYPFRHSNLDCILTHVRKHLDITIGCPICGKGYQNATSLRKHGRDVHSIQIVTSSTSLSGVIPKEEIKIFLIVHIALPLLKGFIAPRHQCL